MVSVDRLASVGASPQVEHGNGDLGVYLDLTFACTWLSGEARVADDENTDVRWWPVDALPPMSDVPPPSGSTTSSRVRPRPASAPEPRRLDRC